MQGGPATFIRGFKGFEEEKKQRKVFKKLAGDFLSLGPYCLVALGEDLAYFF